MWLTLYPKVVMMERCSLSNQFMSLKAQFSTPSKNKKVLKCGLQPIYAYDHPTRDRDVRCFDCKRNVENHKLCLKGQSINQLPNTYMCADNVFDTKCLRDYKNLESLLANNWELKSLKSLFCSNCSQLQFFR